MQANTISLNRERVAPTPGNELWLFGYGSLIFKADFPYLERKPASIAGWERRFWQGSHDHRGTRDQPGRVVTLTPVPDSRCAGMGYRIERDVLEHLDHREKNGYLRIVTELEFADGGADTGLVYIADSNNAAFLGALDEGEIARQIVRCAGPSGANSDYLLELARALRALAVEDAHVFEIESRVLALLGDDSL